MYLIHFLLIAASHLSLPFLVVCYYFDTYRCIRTSNTSDHSLYEVPFERLVTSLANIPLPFFLCMLAHHPSHVTPDLSNRSLYSRCLFRVLAGLHQRSAMTDYTQQSAGVVHVSTNENSKHIVARKTGLWESVARLGLRTSFSHFFLSSCDPL